ncbi:MAG: DUF421 domain-containing protein [Bacteroidia bacterium]
MKLLVEIFGEGNNLTILNMCSRTALVFIIALILIRISGKRAFGMNMPMDNVITILLGALLSRAIVGASPFIATIASALLMVILYRICAQLAVISKAFGKLVKGKELLIYKNGQMLHENMKKAMVTEKDLVEEMRIKANLDSLKNVEAAYIERNGEISIVKKTIKLKYMSFGEKRQTK